jgi:hypothetical protein
MSATPGSTARPTAERRCPFKGAPGGDDYHELRIDPADPRRMITASDQGAVVTLDGGKTWSSWYNQPTAQFYHVATDSRFPYWIYGAQQDSGAAATPSRTDYGTILLRDWKPIAAGGENGYIAPDPTDPNILYGGGVGPLRPDHPPGAERGPDPRLPDDTAASGRCPWQSRRATRRRSTSATSSSSARPTPGSTGRGSAPT